MSISRGTLITSSVLVLVAAGSLEAQPGSHRPDPAFRQGPGVEAIMSLREELELSTDQVEALDEVRRSAVAIRTAHRTQMAEVRSRVQAGEARRSELMALREELHEGATETRENLRSQVEAILEPEQLEKLEQMRLQREAFRRGRAFERRHGEARGMRGHDGGSPRQDDRPHHRRGPRRGGDAPGDG